MYRQFTWAPIENDTVQQALSSQNKHFNYEPVPGLTSKDINGLPQFDGNLEDYRDLWNYVTSLRKSTKSNFVMLSAENQFDFTSGQPLTNLVGWLSEVYKLIPAVTQPKLIIARTKGLEQYDFQIFTDERIAVLSGFSGRYKFTLDNAIKFGKLVGSNIRGTPFITGSLESFTLLNDIYNKEMGLAEAKVYPNSRLVPGNSTEHKLLQTKTWFTGSGDDVFDPKTGKTKSDKAEPTA